MLKTVEEKIATIKGNANKKPSFSVQQCVDELIALGHKVETDLDNDGLVFSIPANAAKGKLNRVEEIKRYDVLYVSILGGIPHYLIVDRVFDDVVYCLVITSKFKEHLILDTIKGDRIFNGGFVTNSYEDKTEAYRFFQKIKKYYKQLFENESN